MKGKLARSYVAAGLSVGFLTASFCAVSAEEVEVELKSGNAKICAPVAAPCAPVTVEQQVTVKETVPARMTTKITVPQKTVDMKTTETVKVTESERVLTPKAAESPQRKVARRPLRKRVARKVAARKTTKPRIVYRTKWNTRTIEKCKTIEKERIVEKPVFVDRPIYIYEPPTTIIENAATIPAAAACDPAILNTAIDAPVVIKDKDDEWKLIELDTPILDISIP